MVNRLKEDKIELPAKTEPVWLPGGVGRPPLAPLATDLCWFTALWVLMLDGRCRGLVGRFGLVCGPPLLMLCKDTIICGFCLHIRRVFVLFLTCAPENINSRKQLWS